MMKQRSTADTVILILTITVSFVVVVTVSAIIAVEFWRPGSDISGLAARLGQIITQVIGVIVGYLAGKGAKSD